MTKSNKELDDLLSAYPAAVQEVALKLREMILSTIPKAQEMVDVSARVVGYGYGSGYKDLICTIILSKAGVKLGLVGGAQLPDPNELLEGAGKRHRYVPLNSLADLKKPGLKQLLKAGSKSKRD